LGFISPDYLLEREDRYIYYFVEQERELPKELKFIMTDIPKLTEQFRKFLDENIKPNREHLINDLALLIREDVVLPEDTKERLLLLSGELALPEFLAELFVFAVDSAYNNNDGVKQRISRKRFNLLKEIHKAKNNKVLFDLAKLAITEQDVRSLTVCLDKMTNNIYMARTLVFLSQDENFTEHPEYSDMFHTNFSGMDNNAYRYSVFKGCLEAGCFKKHPESILEPHMREYTNNRYTYDTLILLCELGLHRQMEQHRHLLTNRAYIRRLDTYLAERS